MPADAEWEASCCLVDNSDAEINSARCVHTQFCASSRSPSLHHIAQQAICAHHTILDGLRDAYSVNVACHSRLWEEEGNRGLMDLSNFVTARLRVCLGVMRYHHWQSWQVGGNKMWPHKSSTGMIAAIGAGVSWASLFTCAHSTCASSVGRSESDVKNSDRELPDARYRPISEHASRTLRYRTWPCSEPTHACVNSSIDDMFRLANK
jgi:hypothetical protein